MEFLEPWYAISNQLSFDEELRRELVPGHTLHGIELSAIARRDDRDDVLYSFNDGSGRVAVVHLSWSKETTPQWPQTTIFANQESWAITAMATDHAEFSA